MPAINENQSQLDQASLNTFIARAGRSGNLISGAINTLAAQLKSLTATQVVDQGTIAEIQGALTALEQSTSSTDATLQSLLSADAQTIANLQTLISTINGDGGASISQLLSAINQNAAAIAAANAAITTLQTQAAATQSLVENQIATVESAITALTGGLNTQATGVELIDANADGTADINQSS